MISSSVQIAAEVVQQQSRAPLFTQAVTEGGGEEGRPSLLSHPDPSKTNTLPSRSIFAAPDEDHTPFSSPSAESARLSRHVEAWTVAEGKEGEEEAEAKQSNDKKAVPPLMTEGRRL